MHAMQAAIFMHACMQADVFFQYLHQACVNRSAGSSSLCLHLHVQAEISDCAYVLTRSVKQTQKLAKRLTMLVLIVCSASLQPRRRGQASPDLLPLRIALLFPVLFLRADTPPLTCRC